MESIGGVRPETAAASGGARAGDVGGRRCALLLLFALLASSALRVGVALRDPEFARTTSAGLLKSDPALLYYFTERIVEAGGRAPQDFRADPRVEWPELVDLPATFAIGQEFLVAWCHLLARGALSLHMTALIVMALSASAALLGAFGLARELGGSRRVGLFAAALWCLLPANYRTIGFVLVREDLAFPLLALALWLCARALRRGAARDFAGAGALLAAALATWHATGFFLALAAAAAWLVFALRGRNPLGAPSAAWIAPPLLLGCSLVPVLRATTAILGPAVLLGAGLWVAGRIAPVGRRALSLAVALGILALGLGARALLAERLDDYAHVHELLLAKLRFLGVPPADPRELSFDVRLLWQGPFETFRAGWAPPLLGLALLAPLAAASLLARERGPRGGGAWGAQDSRATLALTCLLALPVTWLVSRTVILLGLVAPVTLALWLARTGRGARARRAAPLALALQALLLAWQMNGYGIPWYRPTGRQAEIATLVAALPSLVPPGEAIATDFMNGPAILAHTRHPIVMQPKYETARSRRRIERFLTTFFFEDAAALHRLLQDELRCNYVLFDRFTLGYLAPYLAGLGPGEEPPPGSAAELFLSQDEQRLRTVPGYELIYRSPPTIRQRDGSPYDFFRLYRLRDR